MRLSLVTGGAGFVGRHLTGLLRAPGAPARVFDLACAETPDDIEGSVTDPDAAARAVEGADTVFHLAGNAQLWARDGRAFDRVNRGGAAVMLNAAKSAGVRRFVHCSSLTTLVGRATPIGPSHADELRRLGPEAMLGPYPRSKLEAETAGERAAPRGADAGVALSPQTPGAGR